MHFSQLNLLSVAASFVLALVLTPLVRAFACRFGVVATPKTDRSHKKPTAMLGDVAIWLSVITTYLIFLPHTPYGWVIIHPSSFLSLAGLIDELSHVKPYRC